MKKIILIDGNNFMFRSYYATLYSGSVMRNSKGFVTNALYGFVTMINKIIKEQNPEYMVVAFDIGKNFRHEKYEAYKDGRAKTPDDLKAQMPIARDLLDAMGIKHVELEGYEADDIIGTIASFCDKDPSFDGLIVSSDKDLLQLISPVVKVNLLKTKGSILYDEDTFKKDYGFEPIKIIDLKALMGDSSDNIPGVKGVGEKTAMNLISTYGSLNAVYDNIDNIKGKLKEKLELGKDDAYFSFDLATIYREVPIDDDLNVYKYNGPDANKLNDIYKELEFYSLMDENIKENTDVEYIEVNNIKDINDSIEYSYYIECSDENYHFGEILGLSLYDGNKCYFVNKDLISEVLKKIKSKLRYTFDLKKNIVLLKNIGITFDNTDYDAMISYYLLGSIKDDLTSKMKKKGIYSYEYKELVKKKIDEEDFKKGIVNKSKFIWDEKDTLIEELKKENMFSLFNDVEMPLVRVLADMELVGIRLDENVLIAMKEILEEKLNVLEEKIYAIGGKFNISSPKQLAEVLFEKLEIPYPKKKSKTYSTDVSVLSKLLDYEIVTLVLEYRTLKKLLTTYVEPLKSFKKEDGKIHTIYKQTLTRTGRLSSVYPNMQNIPSKEEEGKMIKKAFIPEENSILLSADYSQIELRILAEISGDKNMIDAFNNDEDIHKRVAANIFNVDIRDVTSKQRSYAKHIVFGIVYGMSGFGLGENLSISPKEASEFINKFYEKFDGVKKYMDDIVVKSKEEGYVTTLFNRKRYIDEYNSPIYMVRKTAERLALNTPIQGTGADIMKMAMILIHKKLKKEKLKSKLLLQIHDEVILNVYKDEEEKVKKLVKESMENIVKFKVPLKVEIETGSNWYEAK